MLVETSLKHSFPCWKQAPVLTHLEVRNNDLFQQTFLKLITHLKTSEKSQGFRTAWGVLRR